MKFNSLIRTGMCSGLLMAMTSSVYAANPETVTVNVEFVAPITISTSTNLSYGLISTDLATAETIAIATDSSVTDASSRIIGGSQTAASLTVGASASQAITIAIGSITNNTGYTLGSFLCNYDGGGSGACGSETSASSATLLVGATLTGDGSDAAGVVNGSFDVTITYD